MCGIFGLRIKGGAQLTKHRFERAIHQLFQDAQERGRDASGALFVFNNQLTLLKQAGLPSEFVKSEKFQQTLSETQEFLEKGVFVLGQCRLVMSGSAIHPESNQPIVAGKLFGLHNGIITKLEGDRIDHDSTVHSQSDSWVFFNKLSERIEVAGDEKSVFSELLSTAEGAYNIACYSQQSNQVILSSNTGSIFYYEDDQIFIFCSEPGFVENAVKALGISIEKPIDQLTNGEIVLRDVSTSQLIQKVFLPKTKHELRRCSRCILPHTYPFIAFNEQGVCNFCLSYEKQKVHGEKELEKFLEPYRSKDGRPDCLVGLSGGRDSSYGIYMLKEKFGMNPIAYTFDWGLTTDASRKNQARVCGKLGIEHIIRAPDIDERRRHVQKNVHAFFKRPHLGMVPLFMAGDKDFYHFGRKLRKERGLKLTVHCTGHEVERLHFKTGFCGVDDQKTHNVKLYDITVLNKLKLAFFYAGQYILNPSYINESFYYSLRAFVYNFLEKDDFLYLFQYLAWDEQEVERVIKEKLGWESDQKYGKNQWRMGDGQTAFTNLIYHTVAGFSEFDNFRANQVRAGLISREEALRLAEDDNQPKWETLEYFASVVGVNLESVVKKIQNIPKLT